MIGDLTGFAASILKRGCKFIQLPTTLLAQVDSSVGGKTAINTPAGKNLVGAFHQPVAGAGRSGRAGHPARARTAAGYAEVVKYGLLGDADFFAWCDANGGAMLAGDARRANMPSPIRLPPRPGSSADERETTGLRALLNLGHTFGHALEAETGFSDRLLHGEGVALGMVLAARYSAARGLMPQASAEHVARPLRRHRHGQRDCRAWPQLRRQARWPRTCCTTRRWTQAPCPSC